MPKIAFALSSFYPAQRAGTETYVLNLGKLLLKAGYHVSVIIPAVGKKSYSYNYEGIDVYAFEVPLKTSVAEMNGLRKPTGINEFKNILLQLKADIFHLHTLSRSLHAEHLKVAAELGIKTIYTAHLGGNFCARGDLLLYGKKQCDGLVKKQRCLACFINKQKSLLPLVSGLLSFIANKLLLCHTFLLKYPAFNIVNYKLEQLALVKKFNHLNIAISNGLKKIFLINGFNNVIHIKAGIDESFVQIKREANKNKDGINLIFIGRMHPDKGVHLILEALKKINSQIFNLTIITIPFVDEMNYYQNIKSLYFGLGYKNWFENLPSVSVAEHLEESDILVLPSKFETAPLSILEAFAKKVPVIGSDYLAIQEMVTHNFNGLIFKNGISESLKEQLIRLINEPGLLQSLKQNIGSVRTFKEVAEEHKVIYVNLIKESNSIKNYNKHNL